MLTLLEMFPESVAEWLGGIESWLASVFDWVDVLYPAILVLVGATTRIVRSGQQGVHFRWGRVRGVRSAGFHWVIPIVDHIEMHHVTSQSLDVPYQWVMTRDQREIGVDANIVYRVGRPDLAAVEVADVHRGINTIVAMAVHDVVASRRYEELWDRGVLDEALREAVEPKLSAWGVEIERVGFNSLAPEGVTLVLTQLRQEVLERRVMFEGYLQAGLSERRALELVGSNVEVSESWRATIRAETEEAPEVWSDQEPRREVDLTEIVKLFAGLALVVMGLVVLWYTSPNPEDWPSNPALQDQHECGTVDTGLTPLNDTEE